MSDLYASFIRHCGEALNAGKHDEVQSLISGYMANKTDDPTALYLIGSSFLQQGKDGLAIHLLQESVRLAPDMDYVWHNLGIAYRKTERYDDAKLAYEKALEINPDRTDTMAMLAGLYVNAGDPDPGIVWARKCLDLDPADPHARNHLALMLLEKEEFEEGWAHYARRWDVPERAALKRDYGDIPKWDGGPTKRLVVHGEQGLGDEIMFLTCLPKSLPVEELVIECATRLTRLVRRSFGCEVYGTHDEVMARDKPTAWISMGDLPAMFEPSREPVLAVDPVRRAYWRAKLEALGPGPYVGFAWQGGVSATHKQSRQTSIEDWKPFLDHATCVSVHYQRHAAHDAAQIGIPHWQDAIDDLDETVALIAALDLVISVQQTAVHLAGGVGTPCFVMVSNRPAWRYRLKGNAMRWYDSVRLYRQSSDGTWPFAAALDDLKPMRCKADTWPAGWPTGSFENVFPAAFLNGERKVS